MRGGRGGASRALPKRVKGSQHPCVAKHSRQATERRRAGFGSLTTRLYSRRDWQKETVALLWTREATPFHRSRHERNLSSVPSSYTTQGQPAAHYGTWWSANVGNSEKMFHLSYLKVGDGERFPDAELGRRSRDLAHQHFQQRL